MFKGWPTVAFDCDGGWMVTDNGCGIIAGSCRKDPIQQINDWCDAQKTPEQKQAEQDAEDIEAVRKGCSQPARRIAARLEELTKK